MTKIEIDDDGVDVRYHGTTFRLDKELIESATGKSYPSVTDHEILKLIERDPVLEPPARRVSDILN